MIQLFPTIRKRMTVLLVAFMALVFTLGIFGRTSIPGLILISLIGVAAIFISQNLNAEKAHDQLLARLYSALDAEGFISEYRPMLTAYIKHPKLYLMIRVHMANAYCAVGRFDEAILLLGSIDFPARKKKEDDLLARYTVAGNLCYCALLKGDIAAAQQYMDESLSFKQQLDALQQNKPEAQRMVFSNTLNEQCLMLLKTGACDVSVLRSKVQSQNTQNLHRVMTGLWIARALIADGSRDEAAALLEKIAAIAGHLYAGKQAKALLRSLNPETPNA